MGTLAAGHTIRRIALAAASVAIVAGAGLFYLRPGSGSPAHGAAVVPESTARPVAEVHLGSAQRGWVTVGGPAAGMLATRDGGRHWTRLLTLPEGEPRGLTFFDGEHGMLSAHGPGGPALWRTDDGGALWRRASLPEGPGTAVGPTFFLNSRRGWYLVLGPPGGSVGGIPFQQEATLYRTDDGATTWHRLVATGGLGAAFADTGIKTWVSFQDDQVGWIGGEAFGGSPLLWRSLDGGATWAGVVLPPPAGNPPRLELAPPPAMFADGSGALLAREDQDGGPVGVVLRTPDGGEDWGDASRVPDLTPGDATWLTATFLDTRRWWVGVGPTLWTTADAGGHWQPGGRAPGGGAFAQLSVLDDRQAWAAVTGPTGRYDLAATADGGHHWRTIALDR